MHPVVHIYLIIYAVNHHQTGIYYQCVKNKLREQVSVLPDHHQV